MGKFQQRFGGHPHNSKPYNKNNYKQKHNNNNRPNLNKPKEVPINHKIKGPLFDKSKLSPKWKITRKIGPGLINGQNTCFLNSVLECLTYSPAFANYLLQEEHKKTCKQALFFFFGLSKTQR